MGNTTYPPIPGTVPLQHPSLLPSGAIPYDALPQSLTQPPRPTRNSKNIFAFWHSGIKDMPPYLLRNVLAWHQRFSPLGWTIYVVDTVPSSPLNISHYIDTSSPAVVPAAFLSISGESSRQHTSDLVRYPLLLRYGGVYMDVGILQWGDWDALWGAHIANPRSPYDFAGFSMGAGPGSDATIVNFALMCGADNPLVGRAHRILLALWEGRTNTAGMHAHPLVSHVPLMAVPDQVEDEQGAGKKAEGSASMTDYAIQIQCMGAAQRWVDEEAGWNGPDYVREKAWLYSMIDGSFAHEQLTGWSGQRQWELLKLRVPGPGEPESEEQELARHIVEKSVGETWLMKLSHGQSAKLFGGDTLGMLWKKNVGSDCVEGTYAGWLRWAQVNCTQQSLVKPLTGRRYEPTMRGKLIA